MNEGIPVDDLYTITEAELALNEMGGVPNPPLMYEDGCIVSRTMV